MEHYAQQVVPQQERMQAHAAARAQSSIENEHGACGQDGDSNNTECIRGLAKLEA